MLELRVDRVSKSYVRAGQRVVALEDVSLVVPPGRVTAVIGGRGSGKSTLLNVAAGLIRPDSGHVSIGGQRLDQMNDRQLTSLRRTVGLVLGRADSLSGSAVLDSVALPLRLQSGDGRAALAEAEKALAAVGAAHCIEADIDEISDGERRLVAVARAIVSKPRLVMLDQPATELLVDEERQLLGVLRSLAHDAGVAILMTAASATEAISADVVATISGGRLMSGDSPLDSDSEPADVVSIEEKRRGARGGLTDA